MGSLGAMADGSRDRYFQARASRPRSSCPRASRAACPYRGSLTSNIHQLVGGLRSGMGYVGAADLAELRTEGALRAHLARRGCARATCTT